MGAITLMFKNSIVGQRQQTTISVQKHRHPNNFVEVKKSSIHNKGLFAKKNIPKGAFLVEYTGEKISKEEGTKRENISLKLNGTTYIFELDAMCDIDGSSDSNTAKYANHSCDPNCKISIRKQSDGNRHIWLRAARNIKNGEELTFDYGYSASENLYECKCKSKKCLGFIAAKKTSSYKITTQKG